MSKQRYINTTFWDDNYIANLDPSEKLVFIYLLTNPATNISGIYQIPIKRIATDTGFEKEMCQKILDRFQKDIKIRYENGWIAIKNFIKHQNQKSPLVLRGIENELGKAPKHLVEWVLKGMDTLSKGMDTLSHLNLNLNLNLNLTEEEEEGDSKGTKESSKEEEEKKNTEISLKPFLEERFPNKVEPLLELFNRVPEGEDQCIKFFNDRIEYSKSSIIEGIDDVIGRLDKGSITAVNLKYIGKAIDIARNKEDNVQKMEPKFRQFCLDKLGEKDGMVVYNFYREFFNPKKYYECRQFKSRRDEHFTNNINYLVDAFGKDKLLNVIKEFTELDRTGQLETHNIKYFSGAVKKYDKFKGPKKEPKSSTEIPVIVPTRFKRVSNQYEGENEIYNWDFKCTCGAIVTIRSEYCPECHTGLHWASVDRDELSKINID